MSIVIGLAAALVAAAMFGSQFVPLKRLKQPDMLHYSVFMYVSIFIAAVLLTLALGFPFALNYYGLTAGIVWSVGNILQIYAINRIGLAKSTAIPLGVVLVGNFVSGVFFFEEPVNILFGLAGISVFILGIYLVSQSKEQEKSDFLGLVYAFIAGVFFSAPAFLFKLGRLAESQFLFPMAAGVIASGILLFGLKVRKVVANEAKPAFVSGLMWTIGLLTMLYAIVFLGLAIGGPLTQLGLLVGVLWGLFYFKEITDSSTKRKVLIGSILLFGAGVLLTAAKVFV